MFHVCYSRELRLVVAPATMPTVLYRIVLILLSLSLDATPFANAIYDKSKYVKSSIDSVPCSLSSASEGEEGTGYESIIHLVPISSYEYGTKMTLFQNMRVL